MSKTHLFVLVLFENMVVVLLDVLRQWVTHINSTKAVVNDYKSASILHGILQVEYNVSIFNNTNNNNNNSNNNNNNKT